MRSDDFDTTENIQRQEDVSSLTPEHAASPADHFEVEESDDFTPEELTMDVDASGQDSPLSEASFEMERDEDPDAADADDEEDLDDEAEEPVSVFARLGLHPAVVQALEDKGYTEPTPIQEQTIPHLMSGHDVVGLAQTGTGKTAAFALPALSHLARRGAGRGTKVLVLAPTRELALQVADNFSSYSVNLPGIKVLPIYGGQSYGPQLKGLREGAQIVVGTPGRVIDHLERGSLDLSDLDYLVLDEADEMLRMGFQQDVEQILDKTPFEKQVALFSATMPPAIRRIASKYLQDPQEVTVKSKTTTGVNTRQRFATVKASDKAEAITRVLEVEPYDGCIIFVRTRMATESLADKLRGRGLKVAAINGDIPQQQRERTVDRLRDGGIDILVATDVAARGLDVERISLVVNYDIPMDTESYVHRIGRTGRAGRSGDAILFVTPREKRLLKNIERATRQPIESMRLPSTDAVNDARQAKFAEQITAIRGGSRMREFLPFVDRYLEENEADGRELAAALAVLAHGDEPFMVTELAQPTDDDRSSRRERDSDRGRDRGGRSPRAGDENLIAYKLNVGRRHGAQPGAIVGALANEGGLSSSDIGQIDIRPDFSLVHLPRELSKDVLRNLKDTKVAGQFINIRPDRGPRQGGGFSRDRGGYERHDRGGRDFGRDRGERGGRGGFGTQRIRGEFGTRSNGKHNDSFHEGGSKGRNRKGYRD